MTNCECGAPLMDGAQNCIWCGAQVPTQKNITAPLVCDGATMVLEFRDGAEQKSPNRPVVETSTAGRGEMDYEVPSFEELAALVGYQSLFVGAGQNRDALPNAVLYSLLEGQMVSEGAMREGAEVQDGANQRGDVLSEAKNIPLHSALLAHLWAHPSLMEFFKGTIYFTVFLLVVLAVLPHG